MECFASKVFEIKTLQNKLFVLKTLGTSLGEGGSPNSKGMQDARATIPKARREVVPPRPRTSRLELAAWLQPLGRPALCLVPCFYAAPPRRGARWVPDHYRHTRRGYFWVEDHWR